MNTHSNHQINTEIGSIFYYVSGHGYGHAIRSIEVMKALNVLNPEIPILVRSSASQNVFRDDFPETRFHHETYDIGVIQYDSLNLDIHKTIQACHHLLDHYPQIIASEIESARMLNCKMIVSDIPSVAGQIACKLNIPSLVISNFSWDWIYEMWSEKFPEINDIIHQFQCDYSQFDLLLRLPFSHELPAFKDNQPIPLIGRKAKFDSTETKKRLSLPLNRPLVLLSFGGMGLKNINLDKLKEFNDYFFISLSDYQVPGHKIDNLDLKSCELEYPDLVHAVDIVVTKPGYGIVSECAVNATKMLYTDRGPFREYEVIVDQMKEMMTSLYIPRHDFEDGHWNHYLDKLMHQPQSSPVSAEGAQVAAECIMGYLCEN